MTILRKLREYLDEKKVRYEVSSHREAYTAQEIAAALHVPGQKLAKVVMVKAGERFVMVVLPATWKIDMQKMKKIVGAADTRIATEDEFKDLFPGCDVGAMPPFGNLYNLDVYVDKSLTEDREIVFNAGTHVDTVNMNYQDFAALVKPIVAEFGKHV
ncbi:MAG TPA: aminoacyl-tRNA deacylase [Candidatus Brocadiia bacterium]|nr:YbaK/EbsC family protein [Planctomycetota bacterium]MDO8092073.1 YbaK/EbsC family protein [Candidatus Brocadiales bacterium]